MDTTKSIIDKLNEVERNMDKMIMDMYQNRLDKRDLINQLWKHQNPTLDEAQEKIEKQKEEEELLKKDNSN